MIQGTHFPIDISPSGKGSYDRRPRPLRELVHAAAGDPQINLKPTVVWDISWTADILTPQELDRLQAHFLNNTGKWFNFFDVFTTRAISSEGYDQILFGPIVEDQFDYTLPAMNAAGQIAVSYPGASPGSTVVLFGPPIGSAFTVTPNGGDEGADLITFAPASMPDPGTTMSLLLAAGGRRRWPVIYVNEAFPGSYDEGDNWSLSEPLRFESLVYTHG